MSNPQTRQLPPATFSSFITSVAASAMASLGEGPGATEDLQMARHTIDILGVLKEKTAGNLDEEEEKLLETLLYETRMQFVQKAGTGATDD